MRRFDLAIFDCDGVLFDSREANRLYYNAVLARMGRSAMNEEDLSFVHMHTAEESVRYLFRDDPPTAAKALEFTTCLDYSEYIRFMTMEPGVPETIETIRPPLLTAISTNRSTTMRQLRETFHLDRWFDSIVCALDVARAKPDPEGVFKILAELGVRRERAIYIGDSQVDEEVAVRSGLPLMAYKNPGLSASFHVRHFREIGAILLADRRNGPRG